MTKLQANPGFFRLTESNKTLLVDIWRWHLVVVPILLVPVLVPNVVSSHDEKAGVPLVLSLSLDLTGPTQEQ